MEKRKTANGIEHGLVNTLINQVPKGRRFKNVEPKQREELEAKMKRNAELVTVRYINYKNQENGQYNCDYSVGAGEPIYMFRFLHDHVYKIPKGLVDLVNSPNMTFRKLEGSVDENGQPRDKDGPKRRIHQFVQDLF